MAIQPKTALLQLRVSPVLHSKLTVMAAYQDRTVSDVVRRLLSHEVGLFEAHLAKTAKSIVEGVIVQGDVSRAVNIVNSNLKAVAQKSKGRR